MSDIAEEAVSQLDRLLSLPKQIWLLGAGISKEAGVPLMYPLTDLIGEQLEGQSRDDFEALRQRLRNDAHVEHVLSRISNLVELAEHSSDQTAPFGKDTRSVDELHALHRSIQSELRKIVRWGAREDPNNGESIVGARDNPLINIEDHFSFAEALFQHRRAGLEQRPPVAIFTTNYDTLLEDALALNEVKAADGFSGGSMAYWNPRDVDERLLQPFERHSGVDAKLYKLHGSIDWYESAENVVVRRREGTQYSPDTEDRLLVYPQATKYQTTQQAPFSSLFRGFRRALNHSKEGVMCICGYGYGDRHINNEIESSLKRSSNRLTVLACTKEADTEEDAPPGFGLPHVLRSWLSSDAAWTDRLIVISQRAFYHGDLENQLTGSEGWPLWSFQGLTKFLARGPEVIEDV